MIPQIFVPRVAILRAGRGESGTRMLVTLRQLFLMYIAACCLVGVIVVVLGDLHGGPHPATLSIVVVFVAGCGTLIAQRALIKPLDCSTSAALATSYRQRFFLRIALSESAALIAFAVEISMGPWWVFSIGAGFTLVGFVHLAPTARNLRHDQDALNRRGCQLSVVDSLLRA